jgi:putative transposase
MKNSKFNEEQILMVQKNQELGKKVSEICREFGISEPTFYKWKSRYGGMTISDLQRVKELESKNARLKR